MWLCFCGTTVKNEDLGVCQRSNSKRISGQDYVHLCALCFIAVNLIQIQDPICLQLHSLGCVLRTFGRLWFTVKQELQQHI